MGGGGGGGGLHPGIHPCAYMRGIRYTVYIDRLHHMQNLCIMHVICIIRVSQLVIISHKVMGTGYSKDMS